MSHQDFVPWCWFFKALRKSINNATPSHEVIMIMMLVNVCWHRVLKNPMRNQIHLGLQQTDRLTAAVALCRLDECRTSCNRITIIKTPIAVIATIVHIKFSLFWCRNLPFIIAEMFVASPIYLQPCPKMHWSGHVKLPIILAVFWLTWLKCSWPAQCLMFTNDSFVPLERLTHTQTAIETIKHFHRNIRRQPDSIIV